MSTQYSNAGPIYTTAAKYETMRTAGTLEAGREYKITDWEPQEQLKDSTTIETGETANIKTINNSSILGSGNLSITASLPDWAGVPFSSGGKPTLNGLGYGTFDICFVGTSTGGTCLYDLGTLTVMSSGSLAGISPRGPMAKKKYSATTSSDANEYFMAEYGGGLLKIWSINASTGVETDATPIRISTETESTKLFYRKSN